jgi:hypothetical protein
MRLKEYIKYWSTIERMDEDELIYQIEEVLDLKTKVKRDNSGEWYFWVDDDLYTVRVGKMAEGHYMISFVYNEPSGEVSSITDKGTPFRVLDGVAVVIKEFIEESDPIIIEFTTYAKKKASIFKKIIKMALKKHRNIFGSFDVTEEKVSLRYGRHYEGVKFLLVKKI